MAALALVQPGGTAVSLGSGMSIDTALTATTATTATTDTTRTVTIHTSTGHTITISIGRTITTSIGRIAIIGIGVCDQALATPTKMPGHSPTMDGCSDSDCLKSVHNSC